MPQLELLRLLALLGAGDKAASENMYAVVAEVKRRAEPLGNNIGALCGGQGKFGGASAVVGGRYGTVAPQQRSMPAEQAAHLPARLPGLAIQIGTCVHPPCLTHTHARTAGNALVFECVCTITAIHPTAVLLAGAAESVARFLGARENNLRYAGIDALTRLVEIDPKHAQVGLRQLPACLALRRLCAAADRVRQPSAFPACPRRGPSALPPRHQTRCAAVPAGPQEHQLAVVDCLRSPDVTLKRKTLQLLYKMAGPSNIEARGAIGQEPGEACHCPFPAGRKVVGYPGSARTRQPSCSPVDVSPPCIGSRHSLPPPLRRSLPARCWAT